MGRMTDRPTFWERALAPAAAADPAGVALFSVASAHERAASAAAPTSPAGAPRRR
jgi:hypothetical protein